MTAFSGTAPIRGDESIAAVVLNYRDAKRTLACLRSLAGQGLSRVVVWDNSDDTGASANELAQLLAAEPMSDASMDHVQSPANLGFAAGVNAALRHLEADGQVDYVLLVNNDAVLPPHAVAQLMTAMRKNRRAVAAMPGVRTGGRVHGVLHHHRWLGIQTRHPLPGSFRYASGACLLLDGRRIPRPLLDESFFMYSEDVALGWQVHCARQQIAVVDDVVVEHAGSASSGLGSPFYEYNVALGNLRLVPLLARNRSQFLFMTSLRALVLCARAVVRTVRARNAIPLVQTWRALRDFVSSPRH